MYFVFQNDFIRDGGHSKSWQKLQPGNGTPEGMKRHSLWHPAVACRGYSVGSVAGQMI